MYTAGQQEDASITGDEVDVNVVDGTLDEPSNGQAGAYNDGNSVNARIESHELTLEATTFSPSGMEEKHSVVKTCDGFRAFGQQQEVFCDQGPAINWNVIKLYIIIIIIIIIIIHSCQCYDCMYLYIATGFMDPRFQLEALH